MHDRQAHIEATWCYDYEYTPFQECMEKVDERYTYEQLKQIWDSMEYHKELYTNSHYEFAKEHMINRLEIIMGKYAQVIHELFNEPL